MHLSGYNRPSGLSFTIRRAIPEPQAHSRCCFWDGHAYWNLFCFCLEEVSDSFPTIKIRELLKILEGRKRKLQTSSQKSYFEKKRSLYLPTQQLLKLLSGLLSFFGHLNEDKCYLRKISSSKNSRKQHLESLKLFSWKAQLESMDTWQQRENKPHWTDVGHSA